MIKKYQIYLIKQFLKNILVISLIFFAISFILNFFEELKFFDNYDVGIKYPVFLTFLNSPSILFELFHLFFLISVKFFYIELIEKNEIEIFKNNGVNYLQNNFYSFTNFIFVGIFIIIFFIHSHQF